MKKRLKPLIAAIVLLIVMAACGSPKTGTKPAGDTTAASSADVSTTEAASPEKEAAGTTAAVTTTAGTTEAAAAEADVVFETTDLDGNTVSSAELFAANKLTMINIWGTYCRPCISEMPDLEVLNGRLREKGCAIVGVMGDVPGPDARTASDAEEIIAATGVTYPNLFPWETFLSDLPAMYIPTTYFIDSDGMIVGEAAVGARGADDYEALVDELLSKMAD